MSQQKIWFINKDGASILQLLQNILKHDNINFYMPRCPNCNYALVLLKHRHKYKCAKCSKIFSETEIDTKEFIEYNKTERIKARKQYARETSQDHKAKKIIPKIINELKNPKLKQSEAERKREYRKNLSEQERKEQNEKRKARRMDNLKITRAKGTIEYWRMRQKCLALRMLDFEKERACTVEIKETLPTLLLS